MGLSQRTCQIDGCINPSSKKSWCNKHYKRWLRHGDPLYERVGECAKCGDNFTPPRTGPIPPVCKPCKIPQCRGCGKPVPLVKRGGPRGGLISSGYYCNDNCKPRCSVEGCTKPRRKRGWCANHYATWRDHGSPVAEVAYTWVERTACWTCGLDDFELWEAQSRKFCSDRCQVTWWKYDGQVPHGFNCAICDEYVTYYDPVTRKRLRSETKYCRKHARHGRVPITAQQIAAEDGNICKLCDEPVDMSLTGTQSRAPSVDHIVPRSLGGTDYRENLQLAHFGCNASKRHRYIG